MGPMELCWWVPVAQAMPCEEMNWKMSCWLQEKFITPAEAGRKGQSLGLDFIPQPYSSGGTPVGLQGSGVEGLCWWQKPCAGSQCADTALPGELLERRKAVSCKEAHGLRCAPVHV